MGKLITKYVSGGAYSGPPPATGGRGTFKLLAQTQEEEDAFDFIRFRNLEKPSGLIGSIAHLVKGALGGGILGGHVAYMKAGVWPSVILTFVFGLYIGYSLYVLAKCSHVLYKRTRVVAMSYPDVGEAAVACFPNPKIAKWAKCFRYFIDFIICVDLFGACACYQIIIAKTIKQLVEMSQESVIEGLHGYPNLRVYLAAIAFPVVLICWIRHLKWLAPFSIVANVFIVVCIFVTVHYAFENNPGIENLESFTNVYESIEFLGMIVFSMSCAGVILPVCNNMKDPMKYPIVVIVGMFFIILFVLLISFFGYVAYLDKCQSPITVNFPLVTFPIILKFMIAFMIYVTHALNFWVPFNLCFYYLEPLHNPEKIVYWELFYRMIFVLCISAVAIAFPTINSLMGFLGAFCLSWMAFIWPNMIELLIVWYRPGLGTMNWRLWKSIVLIAIGLFLMCIGSLVNVKEMLAVYF